MLKHFNERKQLEKNFQLLLIDIKEEVNVTSSSSSCVRSGPKWSSSSFSISSSEQELETTRESPSHTFPPELQPKAMTLGTSFTCLSMPIDMFLFWCQQKWFVLMMILVGINLFSFLVGVFFVEDYREQCDEKNDDMKQALIDGESNETNENANSNVL